VPQNKDLKRLVRTRMAETGENYTQALTHLQGQTALGDGGQVAGLLSDLGFDQVG
jgi:hypothetical protein